MIDRRVIYLLTPSELAVVDQGPYFQANPAPSEYNEAEITLKFRTVHSIVNVHLVEIRKCTMSVNAVRCSSGPFNSRSRGHARLTMLCIPHSDWLTLSTQSTRLSVFLAVTRVPRQPTSCWWSEIELNTTRRRHSRQQYSLPSRRHHGYRRVKLFHGTIGWWWRSMNLRRAVCAVELVPEEHFNATMSTKWSIEFEIREVTRTVANHMNEKERNSRERDREREREKGDGGREGCAGRRRNHSMSAAIVHRHSGWPTCDATRRHHAAMPRTSPVNIVIKCIGNFRTFWYEQSTSI